MGKRSNFERRERDFYETPIEAVIPLIKHLPSNFGYIEPCAGSGKLRDGLNEHGGVCLSAFDIEPKAPEIEKKNAFHFTESVKRIITNPPWTREILHPMIEHFTRIAEETWLLFDSDWPHTRQSADLMKKCAAMVSIGRVKWIPGSKHTGKDNCSWYLFKKSEVKKSIFYGRENGK